MIGMFATSKAGHDKNQLYIIYREDDEYVYLVDGKIRTSNCPKRKKRKHIQPINQKVSEEVLQKLINKLPILEEELKREIKLFSMRNNI